MYALQRDQHDENRCHLYRCHSLRETHICVMQYTNAYDLFQFENRDEEREFIAGARVEVQPKGGEFVPPPTNLAAQIKAELIAANKRALAKIQITDRLAELAADDA